jgi:hypothetical protein
MCKQLPFELGNACKLPSDTITVWYGACFYQGWRSSHPPLVSWMTPRLLRKSETSMKKTLFVFCLLSTAAAFGQYGLGAGVMNNQAQSYQFQTSPRHASYAPMSEEKSVLPSTTFFSAQGDRRPSDFAQPEAMPLGTIARELKRQHAELKKSRVVWINQ